MIRQLTGKCCVVVVTFCKMLPRPAACIDRRHQAAKRSLSMYVAAPPLSEQHSHSAGAPLSKLYYSVSSCARFDRFS